MSYAFLFVNLVMLSACIGLLVHFSIEMRLIRRFAIRSIGKSTEPLEVVLRLVGIIFYTQKNMPVHIDQAFIKLPLFSSLGATPGSILQNGGCCSGITRLSIVGLGALGFKAASVTVCPASGKARHCLLEVCLPTYNVLVDATYGFYYVDVFGKGIALSDLQLGTRPLFASLPGAYKFGYPPNEYYDFDYGRTKTANWTESCVREAVYRLLYFVTRGAIDRIKQPSVLEWPQLVLATFITFWMLFVNLVLAMFD